MTVDVVVVVDGVTTVNPRFCSCKKEKIEMLENTIYGNVIDCNYELVNLPNMRFLDNTLNVMNRTLIVVQLNLTEVLKQEVV